MLADLITQVGGLLSMLGAAVTVGVAFGSLPRLSKDLDRFRKEYREDQQILWEAIHELRGVGPHPRPRGPGQRNGRDD